MFGAQSPPPNSHNVAGFSSCGPSVEVAEDSNQKILVLVL
jgi:hypothetical protein